MTTTEFTAGEQGKKRVKSIHKVIPVPNGKTNSQYLLQKQLLTLNAVITLRFFETRTTVPISHLS